jgi:hypothetical protein
MKIHILRNGWFSSTIIFIRFLWKLLHTKVSSIYDRFSCTLLLTVLLWCFHWTRLQLHKSSLLLESQLVKSPELRVHIYLHAWFYVLTLGMWRKKFFTDIVVILKFLLLFSNDVARQVKVKCSMEWLISVETPYVCCCALNTIYPMFNSVQAVSILVCLAFS